MAKGRLRGLLVPLALVALFGIADGARAQALAWYKLDDGTATDSTGRGNHGVLVGSPSSETGIIDGAMRFGFRESIRIDDSASLRTATPSVSMWIKLEAEGANRARLARKIDSGTGWGISLLRTRQIRFHVQQGSQRASATSPFPIVPGVWTPILASYDGTDLDLYLYGERVARTVFPGLDLSNAGALTLAERLGGVVDEVRLGNRDIGSIPACATALKVWHPASGTCLDTFTNVAADEGLEDTQHRSFGATLVDIDRDGWIDLYYVNGSGDPPLPDRPSGTCPPLPDPIPFADGSANALHMNQGDGTFGHDTAPEVGIADQWNAMRHVWGDYDRDGLLDMVSHNFVLSTLYKQVLDEPLTFEDWNDESGLHICLKRGTGASFIDLDLDGYLDLHVVEYDPSRPATEHLNQTYRNDTLGGFIDITALTGLDLPDNPMGQAWADYDNDGDQDLYQTNSHEVPTRLYRNNGIDIGSGVPTFTDVASAAGVRVIGEPAKGIGASWGDYNNDRRLDLLFSREQDTRLFRNDGPNESGVWTFSDVSDVNGFERARGFGFWGGGFADLNNDGWLDIVLPNRTSGANRVLLNNGDETFSEVTSELDMELDTLPSMGFVAGDRDNDGDVDLVIVSHSPVSSAPQGEGFEGDPNFVYVNNTRGNNWVQFRLIGTVSNPEAVGARIEVEAALVPGGPLVWQSREIAAGTGFFSDFPREQTFGLGKGQKVERVVIKWPNGLSQELLALETNQLYEIVEPAP